MVLAGDKVPMFRLRADRGMLLAAFLVFVVGGLLSLYFFSEDAYLEACRGPFVLIFTVCLVAMLLIGATSRFWFRHLWHHRTGYRYG